MMLSDFKLHLCLTKVCWAKMEQSTVVVRFKCWQHAGLIVLGSTEVCGPGVEVLRAGSACQPVLQSYCLLSHACCRLHMEMLTVVHFSYMTYRWWRTETYCFFIFSVLTKRFRNHNTEQCTHTHNDTFTRWPPAAALLAVLLRAHSLFCLCLFMCTFVSEWLHVYLHVCAHV